MFGEWAKAKSSAVHVAEELLRLLLRVRSLGSAFDVEQVIDAERELTGEFAVFTGFDGEDASDLGTERICWRVGKAGGLRGAEGRGEFGAAVLVNIRSELPGARTVVVNCVAVAVEVVGVGTTDKVCTRS